MPESLPGVQGDDSNHVTNSVPSITPNAAQEETPPPALPALCAQIHEKVERFLNSEPKTERIKNAQAQSRRSLECIEEALRRYR